MASLTEALSSIETDPERRHIVNISGGKDSAALAIYLKRKHPEIPAEYVFCDTKCELPETYEFLDRLEALLGKKIERINAFNYLRIPEKDRNPFDILLKEVNGNYLPSARARWCTGALKIRPLETYLEGSTSYSYIGIRGDENRDGYQGKKPPVFSHKPNIIPVYPFKDDSMGIEDIKDVLDSSGLGMPTYYNWRSRSGCYFCFYQQIGEWQRLKEHHPDLFEKAKEYESEQAGKNWTWVEGKTLDEVVSGEKRNIQPIDQSNGCAICHL